MNKTTQRIIILFSVLAVIGLFAYFLKDILIPYIRMEIANDLDGAKELLASKGIFGFLTVVLVEALQMVVVFIPAEFIQISSGMSYPFYIAILLCDLGVCLGATIIYVLVRLFRFSSDAYAKSEEKINRLVASSKKERSTVLLMYFLFIMPIIPFGAICYFGSGRKVRYGRYLLTVATGVIPSIVTSNLMGAATKYFIGHDLPLSLLVLIIVVLAAVLFAVLFIFLDKVYFKENDGTPDSVLYALFFRLVRFLRGRKQRLHIDDALIKDVEPPYVLLCNHQSFYDFYYLRQLTGNTNFAIVSNRHYVTMPGLKKFAKKAGFIPKKLFCTDFATPVGIRKMIRGGYAVAIFPEGRLSITGMNYPIVERSAAFYKKLGVDIVIANISGAYFANPKWRKKFYKSDIYVQAKRIIRADEAAAMSEEELTRVLDDDLRYDASGEELNTYPQKDKAEGLENVLYRCADCGALYTTKGVGNDFICSACGKVHRFDEHYRFEDDPYTIGEYYERIKALELAELSGFRLETEVNAVAFSEKGKYRTRSKGVCVLTEKEFSYSSDEVSFTVPTDDLSALPFSCDQEFETYHDGKLYYFYPVENRRQVVRWALLADLLREIKNGAEKED